jgi:hypothetical protein
MMANSCSLATHTKRTVLPQLEEEFSASRNMVSSSNHHFGFLRNGLTTQIRYNYDETVLLAALNGSAQIKLSTTDGSYTKGTDGIWTKN